MSSTDTKVYVATTLVPEASLDILRKRYATSVWSEDRPIPRSELLKAVRGIDGLFCSGLNKIDNELLDAAGPQLKVIGTVSVGYDHIDLPECKRRNILVGNTPDVLTDAVAELAVGLLLATSRSFFRAHNELTSLLMTIAISGHWEKVIWAPMYLTGTSVQGSTVGIVGFGRIGQAIGQRLNAFNIKKLLYSGNTEKPEGELLLLSEVNELKLRPIFITGGVVDQDALIEALQSGEIKAAGLDVMTPEPLPPNHPLTKIPNCTLLPHIGSACLETRIAMCNLTAQNIVAGLEGKPLPAPL